MAWLTPENAPVGYGAFYLFLPVDAGGNPLIDFGAIFAGALYELTQAHNFQEYGALTPVETAAVFEAVYTLTFPFVDVP